MAYSISGGVNAYPLGGLARQQAWMLAVLAVGRAVTGLLALWRGYGGGRCAIACHCGRLGVPHDACLQ